MGTSSLTSFAQEIMMILPALIRGMLKKQTDEIARGRITMPQYLVLDLIQTHGPLKMSKIAKEMDVSLPAMTGIVDRLHILGMVARRYEPKDRRIIRIDLTQKGAKVVQEIRIQREKVIQKVFGQLSEKERSDYLKILKKVHHVLYKNKQK